VSFSFRASVANIERCCFFLSLRLRRTPVASFFPYTTLFRSRWPIITVGLIVLNVLAFLGTHWKMDAEATQTIPIKLHILLLAATHPEVQMPRDVGQFVQEFRGQNPVGWGQIQSRNRRAIDGWDVQMHQMEDAAEIQGAMDSLAAQYAKMEKESIRERYAFTPAHPTAISYLTANFLHGGWLHLIGNMWFLWLAGVILE